MSVQIIDNALNKNSLQKLKEAIFSEAFNWTIRNTTAGGQLNPSIKEPIDGLSFVHFAMMEDKRFTDLAIPLEMALFEILSKMNISVEKVHRIIVGCLTHKSFPVKNQIHIDMPYHHHVGLLYLNDCDGDTDVYKTEFSSSVQEHIDGIVDLPDSDIDVSITPAENRFATFYGRKFHRSTHPTNVFRRIVVNFDYS